MPDALVKHPTLVVMLTGSAASAARFAKQLPLDVAARLTTTARGAKRGASSDLTVWRTVGLTESLTAQFIDNLNELRAGSAQCRGDAGQFPADRNFIFQDVA